MNADNCSKDVNEIEACDARKVDRAIEYRKKGMLNRACTLLEEVILNAPKQYICKFEKSGQLYIKFWDRNKFIHFVKWNKNQGSEVSVTWLPSAYPRAYYHLGFINFEKKNYGMAIRFLEAGHRLEPSNPLFIIEKANIIGATGDRAKAISLLKQVPDVGPNVTKHCKAIALRQLGFHLIEQGDIDAAESALHESLKYEPNNDIAKNELEYIFRLKSEGGVTSSSIQYQRSSGPESWLCSSCGTKVDNGIIVKDKGGEEVLICKQCSSKRQI